MGCCRRCILGRVCTLMLQLARLRLLQVTHSCSSLQTLVMPDELGPASQHSRPSLQHAQRAGAAAAPAAARTPTRAAAAAVGAPALARCSGAGASSERMKGTGGGTQASDAAAGSGFGSGAGFNTGGDGGSGLAGLLPWTPLTWRSLRLGGGPGWTLLSGATCAAGSSRWTRRCCRQVSKTMTRLVTTRLAVQSSIPAARCLARRWATRQWLLLLTGGGWYRGRCCRHCGTCWDSRCSSCSPGRVGFRHRQSWLWCSCCGIMG
ncbi:hypothetical protein COO60DRAFT_488143 [Scenedesmus sp. NREL 46B-D3]|nr:hypothetical protein COO60DRAFT_488143 [Scenedesmus sp. NREL 46B-D3]